MQRSNVPAIVSSFGAYQNKNLWAVKEALERSYWSSAAEGVFEIQFLSDDTPLTNVISPHMFQLIRHTPDYSYEAYQTIIQGRLNNDGTVEYGGGRLGQLTAQGIRWQDGAIWSRVQKMPFKGADILDLGMIQAQARLDSKVLMGDIYERNYLY